MSYLVWSLRDLCDKGACRYDVLSGGRKGVPKKQIRVLKSCVGVAVTSREGVKESKNFADVVCTGLD